MAHARESVAHETTVAIVGGTKGVSAYRSMEANCVTQIVDSARHTTPSIADMQYSRVEEVRDTGGVKCRTTANPGMLNVAPIVV